MVIALVRSLSLLILIIVLIIVGGCANTGAKRATRDITRLAEQAHLTMDRVEGNGFRHLAFTRIVQNSSTIWVFLEGDGSPWIHRGTVIADDPTARNPLALQLAIHTPGSIVYLSRPCYAQVMPDSRCTPTLWTSQRYSQNVVASMNAALAKLLLRFPTSAAHRVVLVGYSGGGTLAVLMAHDNPNVAAVITIAGNLDIAAWTQAHGYEPLVGSRNPADESALPRGIYQIHLVGDNDSNISHAIAKRYLDRLDSRQVWHFANFDHVCCWAQQWPNIFQRLQQSLDVSSTIAPLPTENQ